MICPFCSHKTRIYNSRSIQHATQTWRRHQCTSCHACFTTKERIDWTGSTTVVSSTEAAPYSRERLLLSICHAGQSLDLTPSAYADITDSVEQLLQKNRFFETESQEAGIITQTTTEVLARFNTHMALRYVNNVYNNNPPLALIQRLAGGKE
jgi:transcriptional regulator NrdR family protein